MGRAMSKVKLQRRDRKKGTKTKEHIGTIESSETACLESSKEEAAFKKALGYYNQKHKRVEFLVEAFEPLIAGSVNVMEVIPYLFFIDDVGTLREKVRESPRSAVRLLIQKIKDCDEPGKWQTFVEALRAAGYQYIVNLLLEETESDQTINRNLLRLFTPELIQRIDPEEFVHHLLAADVISDMDKQEVQCEQRNRGSIAAAFMLLERIPRRLDRWFDVFVGILERCGMEDFMEYFRAPETFVEKARAGKATDIPTNTSNENKETIYQRPRDISAVKGTKKGYYNQKHKRVEFLVEAFEPLIAGSVNVMEVIPYLFFIDDVGTLREKVRESPRSAVRLLIQNIKDCDEPGKWQTFVEALRAAGYQYIVNLLLEETESDQTINRNLLRLFTPELIQRIDPEEFVHHLLAADVISDMDKQEVQCEQRNRGSIAAAFMLLERIPRRLDRWFDVFVGILERCGMEDFMEYFRAPETIVDKARAGKATDIPTNTSNENNETIYQRPGDISAVKGTLDMKETNVSLQASPTTVDDELYDKTPIHDSEKAMDNDRRCSSDDTTSLRRYADSSAYLCVTSKNAERSCDSTSPIIDDGPIHGQASAYRYRTDRIMNSDPTITRDYDTSSESSIYDDATIYGNASFEIGTDGINGRCVLPSDDDRTQHFSIYIYDGRMGYVSESRHYERRGYSQTLMSTAGQR